MSDADVDVDSVEMQESAAQDAAAEAAHQAAQQAALEQAEQEALLQAQDAAGDDGSDLAALAAGEGDPFNDDVEDVVGTEDTEVEPDTEEDTEVSEAESNVEPESTSATDTVNPTPVNEEAFIPDDTEKFEHPASDTAKESDTQEVSAVVAQSAPSSKVRTDALSSMNTAEFRRRLRDEQVKRSGGPVAAEGHTVRSQLDQARRRGAELGLLDEEALKQFDDEMSYNDSTLDEDQRSAHGPGSPMYEEAKRLGYIVEGDRTSSASSMRIRDAQEARREAEERLRFHHYWQQLAARDYLAKVKTMMQAEDADNGAGVGFRQLGGILADLTLGDGVDESTIDEFIASQDESASDPEDEAVVEEPVVEELTADESDEPFNAEDTVTEDTVTESVIPDEPVTPTTPVVQAAQTAVVEDVTARTPVPETDTVVSAGNTGGAFKGKQPPARKTIDTDMQDTEKKEDTPVTIQEFIEAWEQFSSVERRIVLRRVGLVNADEMEEVYTELQGTVQALTEERDRYEDECVQLKADLEYESGVRRDTEREVLELRNAVNARNPRG